MLIDLRLSADFHGALIQQEEGELELGLYEEALSLTDPLRFHAIQRALDFCQWPPKVRLTLFRMTAPLRALIRPADAARFEEWQKDHPEGDADLFARDMLVNFLELLMPSLPEEAELSVILDKKAYSPAIFLRLAHPGRWASLVTLSSHGPEAILLPPANDENLASYEQVARLAEELSCPHFITEEELHNSWAGLDRLFVTKAISNQGLRALKGFEAAQGEVIFLKN